MNELVNFFVTVSHSVAQHDQELAAYPRLTSHLRQSLPQPPVCWVLQAWPSGGL